MQLVRYGLLPLLVMVLTLNLYGQDSIPDIDYTRPLEYEIGGITIEGANFSDVKTLKAISGLAEGKIIQIPGASIQNAIKNFERLKLFSKIDVLQDSVVGDLIYLKIKVQERPTLSRHGFKGVPKSKHEDLNARVSPYLVKGSMITDHMKTNAARSIKAYFQEKGYYDTQVEVSEEPDKIRKNSSILTFDIDRGDKVKIRNIDFVGNNNVQAKKLRKIMSETKEKRRIFGKSRFDRDNYKDDKDLIVDYYNTLGFRDMSFVEDSVWRGEDGFFNLLMKIDEGTRYYFGDIRWKGNTLYTDAQLGTVLGIQSGDIFNQELLDTRLSFSLDGRDISSLYLDDGYLFFTATPVEIAVRGDTIDMEMRLFEGPQATIERVVIKGNDRTHDHVIRRELRTLPGNKFSRSDIIRSQREIINLGYFNPETVQIGTPVNQQKGTVDIVYDVEETPSDQLELSAGFGGLNGIVGTLGVTFNNFSLRNALQGGQWTPVPQGDGQRLSLRVQSNGRAFRSYNFSFTEPWLGGKKRNSLNVGFVNTTIDQSLFRGTGVDSRFTINRIFAGIGTQLKWPDDFFTSQTTMNIEFINLVNNSGGIRDFVFYDDQGARRTMQNGNFNNFSISQVFSRSSISEPLFPRSGSRISLNIQFTPPYSWFRKDNFWVLSDQERQTAIDEENFDREIRGLSALSKEGEDDLIAEIEGADRFNYLEYHKWRFDAEFYHSIVGKLVLRTSAKMGFLGLYNQDIGYSPFEKYEVGGDGINNQNAGLQGVDIIAMRGYELTDIPANEDENGNSTGGGTVFNKFSLELRYPISLNPSSTIYGLAFLEGANSWLDPSEYNPFSLRRSAGFGLRVFLPMFGLLGFDYGWGFDRPDLNNGASGNYGNFNVIIGFEPD